MERTETEPNSVVLDLAYKGGREYLHSTDIVPALVGLGEDRYGSGAELAVVTLRRPFRHAIRVRFDRPTVFNGSFKLRVGGETIEGWLVETEEAVKRRRIFDSAPLASSASIEPGLARLEAGLKGFTALEAAVGMMKLLARQVDSRFWWLAQLSLTAPLAEVYPLVVRIERVLASQCIVFGIALDGRNVGSSRLIVESSEG